MSYYKLPFLNNIINSKDIIVKFTDSKENIDDMVIINPSLYFYLKQSKEQISYNYKEWDIYKKITNPYEFIHTNYDKNNYISRLKPLSRAYYKMIELINDFNLYKDESNPIKTFHLAEGPGGFIEAIVNVRQNPLDEYYGMTLIHDSDNIPGWKKSNDFLNKYKNIFIERGTTGNGDLYSYDNLMYIKKNHQHKYELVTGDGGFDFSIDFSKQEINATRLIFSQIIFALILQKNRGSFVLKVFDLFTKPSIDMIYLLNSIYSEVYITKPKTSRYANSEKYIVCNGFNLDAFSPIEERLFNTFKVCQNIDYNKYIFSSLFAGEYNFTFKKKIQEINSIIGQQQLNVINNTLIMIKKTNISNNKIDSDKRKHIQLCINWCKENNIPYNDYKKNNIFTD